MREENTKRSVNRSLRSRADAIRSGIQPATSSPFHEPTEIADAEQAVLCCAVLCCAVLCCAVLCCAGLRFANDANRPTSQ